MKRVALIIFAWLSFLFIDLCAGLVFFSPLPIWYILFFFIGFPAIMGFWANDMYYKGLRKKKISADRAKNDLDFISPSSPADNVSSRSVTNTQPTENIIKEIEKADITKHDFIVCYINGHVYKTIPPLQNYYEERQFINNADCIISDGIMYDLTDKNSVMSIAVPSYDIFSNNKVASDLGVTGCLDYVLRMRSSAFWNEGNYPQAVYLLEKATELMKVSSVGWPKHDFFRIVNELNDLGQFDRANKWEEWIEKNIPDPIQNRWSNVLDSCKFLETDLIEVDSFGVCCEECAKYRNRIFSLTGKDRRFPKLPQNPKFCCVSFWPFVDEVSEPAFKADDYIKYSNRPFIDDRTEEDKQKYAEHLAKVEQVLKRREKRELNLTRIIYYHLKTVLPEDAPKSLADFSRMRNANSSNYQKLKQKAAEAGFIFPETLGDPSISTYITI